MAHLQSLIFLLVALRGVISLTDVDRACMKTYSGDLDNDFLVGTWYEVYKFSHVLNYPPSSICVETVIKKPTAAELQEYTNTYKLDDIFSFNDNPILHNRNSGRYPGMLIGNKEFKFHVHDPKSVFFRDGKYEVRAYEKVNNDYMLYQRCFMGGNTKWLLSRNNATNTEEFARVLKIIEPKVRRYQTQRFCAQF